jgi:hypothetical protein
MAKKAKTGSPGRKRILFITSDFKFNKDTFVKWDYGNTGS